MDAYEEGNAQELEKLLRRSRKGTAGSIDLIDGLDLDFLSSMNEMGEEAELDEDDLDPLFHSLHDNPVPTKPPPPVPQNPFHALSHNNRFRKMSFDTIFGGFDGSSRPRSESTASSIGLGYGFSNTSDPFFGEGSGTDSEKDTAFPAGVFDDSPYVLHAQSLEAQRKAVTPMRQMLRRPPRGRAPAVSSMQPAPFAPSTIATSHTRPASKVELRRPSERLQRSSALEGAGGLRQRNYSPPRFRPSSEPTNHSNTSSSSNHITSSPLKLVTSEHRVPMTSSQILQIPKYSMSDGKAKKNRAPLTFSVSNKNDILGPSLIKFMGAYSRESRKERIQRFIDKRNRRVWTKKVKYDVRKNFADSRVRVKGRFVKKEAEDVLRQLLTSDEPLHHTAGGNSSGNEGVPGIVVVSSGNLQSVH